MNNSVTCQMCGQQMKELTSHIFRKHNIKAQEYRKLYPNKNDSIDKKIENIMEEHTERKKNIQSCIDMINAF